jgi:hypothetical protein
MAETKEETTGADLEALPASSSVTDVQAAIQGLNSGAAFFSTVKGSDFATRKLVTSALTSSLPIDEHTGKTIHLSNIVVQPVELQNDETGEIQTAPRVVLIAADGVAYHGTSIGLLSSVRNILAGMGDPSTWDEPLAIQVVRQKSNKGLGSFFTVKLV